MLGGCSKSSISSSCHVHQRHRAHALPFAVLWRPPPPGGQRSYPSPPAASDRARLSAGFPSVFSSPLVAVETVNELSLLLTVRGARPELRPYLLLSHMDVVPVEPGTEVTRVRLESAAK